MLKFLMALLISLMTVALVLGAVVMFTIMSIPITPWSVGAFVVVYAVAGWLCDIGWRGWLAMPHDDWCAMRHGD
jgi:hypothetical protein